MRSFEVRYGSKTHNRIVVKDGIRTFARLLDVNDALLKSIMMA